MAYSTPAIVRKALVPTADGSLPATPSHTAADLSDPQLIDHIAEADAIIDGYIARFYVVPVGETSPGVTPVPISYWSRDIAAYLASCTYRGSMDFTDNDPVARRYKAVMDALKDVSAGKVKLNLPLAAGTGSTAAGGAGPALNPYVGDLWAPGDFGVQPGNDSLGLPYWRSNGGW
jgi:phage gp36-like protein